MLTGGTLVGVHVKNKIVVICLNKENIRGRARRTSFYLASAKPVLFRKRERCKRNHRSERDTCVRVRRSGALRGDSITTAKARISGAGRMPAVRHIAG
ncbi:hypothetical protein FKM82_017064 [Ascaphus truei]